MQPVITASDDCRINVCAESLISLMDMPRMLAADAPIDGNGSLSDRTTIATERNSNFSMLQKDHFSAQTLCFYSLEDFAAMREARAGRNFPQPINAIEVIE